MQVREMGYASPRIDPLKFVPEILKRVSLHPKRLLWIAGMLILSGYCYILARYDMARKKTMLEAWKMVSSTKNLKTEQKYPRSRAENKENKYSSA